ncbi:MAG: FecR domain-containing protein [Balneolaceae bacterium]|nr:FecR domain-containing protein [Balneolaceae bacterium]MBO6545097.1 FecR domain-containing protein [Balneolaceae bacterium]MBO6646493.1 FecR domain-containing protein [Balneolaceae bacterium]
MSTNRVIDLSVKKLSGTITGEELSELEAFISENDELLKVHEEAVTIWEKSNKYVPKVSIDAETSWNSLQRRLKEKPQANVFSLSQFYKIAAAIAISIGLGVSAFNLWDTERYVTNEGEKLEVSLADQSLITLNENSSLTISRVFNKEFRMVVFEGEAYFDITENPEKPFIIETNSTEIRVLGTSFNVDARSEKKSVEVDVTTGLVSLTEIDNSSNQVVLSSGMKGIFNSESKELVSLESENENFQAWRTEVLVFDDLKMPRVLSDIEEYFEIDISASNEDILNCTFTSTFSKPTVREVVEILSLTLDLEYQQVGDQYTLTGEGCKEVQE